MAPERRVLLVDDEPDILEAIAGWLEMNLDDLQVTRAATPDAAMSALHERYDLIVSDYRMPGLDGLDFLRMGREAHPSTPAVLMTAYPDAQLAAKAIDEVGLARFLVKPVDPDAFLALVDTLTSRWQDPAVQGEADRANRAVLDGLRRREAASHPAQPSSGA